MNLTDDNNGCIQDVDKKSAVSCSSLNSCLSARTRQHQHDAIEHDCFVRNLAFSEVAWSIFNSIIFNFAFVQSTLLFSISFQSMNNNAHNNASTVKHFLNYSFTKMLGELLMSIT